MQWYGKYYRSYCWSIIWYRITKLHENCKKSWNVLMEEYRDQKRSSRVCRGMGWRANWIGGWGTYQLHCRMANKRKEIRDKSIPWRLLTFLENDCRIQINAIWGWQCIVQIRPKPRRINRFQFKRVLHLCWLPSTWKGIRRLLLHKTLREQ